MIELPSDLSNHQRTRGSVITVLGEVDASSLGVTIAHEHVLVDLTPTFVPVDLPELVGLRERRVTPELRPTLEQWPVSTTLDNIRLDDSELATEEIQAFARAGGSTIVDCTVDGMGRSPLALKQIAGQSSVNIVAGTGYYVERAHPPEVAGMSVEEIAARLVTEITVGIDDTGVRAGIIGEIGTSGIRRGESTKDGDITPSEKKVLRAAAWASCETGVAIWVHLDPRGEGALAVAEILASEGVQPDRIVMCHMDARPDISYHRRVADLGVFVEYDHFGREHFAGHMNLPYTKDWKRIELLTELIAHGHVAQLLVSQDVCMKMDLHRYGGKGYDHILVEIVPRIREAGVSDAELRDLLVNNPRRALTAT